MLKSLITRQRYHELQRAKFMRYTSTLANYEDIYNRSVTPDVREHFWHAASKRIDWFDEPVQTLTYRESVPHQWTWFSGGTTNACYNAIDRHCIKRGDQTALIYDSPVTDTKARYTYDEMKTEIQKIAGMLRNAGVAASDRVIVYMPMMPEAVMTMLACARIGAIHSVVFGGFSANELAKRIDDARPTAIVAASCGIEPSGPVEYKVLLDAALAKAKHRPNQNIILQRDAVEASIDPTIDICWNEAYCKSPSVQECVPVSSSDPLYILYTSGTTGTPKGILRDTGGHLTALAWTMPNIYGINGGDVWWSASDIGWVVGHSYCVYAPLINGSTTVIYEGKPVGTPDAGAFWRVIAENNVKSMFTAPTAFRSIRAADPHGDLLKRYDLSKFEALFLAGERCDPDTALWAEKTLNVPVIDNWWQTETGSPMASNFMGLKNSPFSRKLGSATFPVPGYDVVCLNDQTGKEEPPGALGTLACKTPLPPGAFTTLWKDPQRFHDAYFATFPGNYNTHDTGIIDEDGYIHVMGRTDDIINVAGHRLSTGAMEQAVSSHTAVAECAVIGVCDKIKGELPIGLCVLVAGVEQDKNEVCKEVIEIVKEAIGPVATFKTCIVVDRLPKTRSGKILRSTMKAIFEGKEYAIPATIDDAQTLDEIKAIAK
mmetsp:Transcript_10200/g.22628  ORF Transcript_10200/g.22628 Transcript_10200/m.22628 type:complete len:657 (-) Transcript_10200:39-2009(-)